MGGGGGGVVGWPQAHVDKVGASFDIKPQKLVKSVWGWGWVGGKWSEIPAQVDKVGVSFDITPQKLVKSVLGGGRGQGGMKFLFLVYSLFFR